MKLDLHVHTIYSAMPGCPFLRDGFNTFDDIVRAVLEKGIDGVAITDHNTIEGALKFKKYLERKDMGIKTIVGEEVRTLSGDVIALDINERITPNMTVGETLDMIRDCNGLSVACHPYIHSGVGERTIRRCKFDAIEVMNSYCSENSNRKAVMLARRLRLSEVGGSDAHTNMAIGNVITQLYDDDTFRAALKKRKTKVYGKITPHLSYAHQILLRLKNPKYIFCNPFKRL